MGNKKEEMGIMMKNPIVIIPGWTYSLEKWEPISKFFKESGFEINIVKVPGLIEKSNEVWDLGKYTDWLNNYLKKFDSKVILIGHSNGGRIAISYSARYPEKIKKLILIDSAGIYHNELPLRVKRFLFKLIAKTGKLISGSNNLKKLLYKITGENDYKAATPNMRKTMINLISVDLKDILEKINTSTLIIWGENDKITLIKDGELMQKIIKNSKLEIIKEARHSPFYTNPDKVFEIIKNAI